MFFHFHRQLEYVGIKYEVEKKTGYILGKVCHDFQIIEKENSDPATTLTQILMRLPVTRS